MKIRVHNSRSKRRAKGGPGLPRLSARKPPQQARSKQLVEAILEAAIRVLSREGSRRFTTIRVAEAAGVSVGSLYQYFPNKESLLFRLQADEWERTWSALREILRDTSVPPFQRVDRLVHAFYESELEEAALRLALDDAGALFRDAPEAKLLKARASADIDVFTREALPRLSAAQRAFASEFFFTALGAIAEKVTERQPTPSETKKWAAATSAMLSAWWRQLG